MTFSKRVLALFPGQGSQKVGMGKQLFDSESIARELFERADTALGFALSRICFEGPAEELTRTAIAQPAILTVSTICYQLANQVLGASLAPVAGAGHSLGEYSALVASGALRFEDAVVLVNKRGTFMQEAVPAGRGKMVAVLGKELTEIETALVAVTKDANVVAQVANINSPGQIVVAGHAEAIDAFKAAIADANMIELPVSAPFHCSLMKPAADRLSAELSRTTVGECAFPIYANFSARPANGAGAIRESLHQQVCGRVRWVECMQNAISETSPELALEFGNGNVLSGLLKRINPAIARATADSSASLTKLL